MLLKYVVQILLSLSGWVMHLPQRVFYLSLVTRDGHGSTMRLNVLFISKICTARVWLRFYKNSVTGGRVFVEVMKNLDGTGDDCWVVKGQELWGRQFNVEDGLAIDASNSIVWLSGGKQENGGRKFEFKDGTVAELYGHTLLGNFGSSSNPIIVNQNSHAIAFLTEYARDGSFSKVVQETADGSTEELRKNAFPQVDLGKGSTFVHYYAGYDKSFVNNKLKDIGGGPTPPTPAEQSAYVDHSIPGIIEAEHYDNGGEGVAFP